MPQLAPYLIFKGNCEEAFNFYKDVFGGDFQFMGRYKDMPPMEGGEKCAPADENKIMHVSLPVGKEGVLMGSDAHPGIQDQTTIGNNFNISINADNKDEADKLYNSLSEGGKQTMPMNKTFWGAYFGMLTDKFGIQWMLNVDERQG